MITLPSRKSDTIMFCFFFLTGMIEILNGEQELSLFLWLQSYKICTRRSLPGSSKTQLKCKRSAHHQSFKSVRDNNELITFAVAKKIHLISDEIFSGTMFENPSFISIIEAVMNRKLEKTNL